LIHVKRRARQPAMLPAMPPVLHATAESATEFRDARAVETWDASFRWRQDGTLRDVTIDDTWARVANALSAEPARAAAYREAFSRWRLLPDVRLLRHAGTDAPPRLAGRVEAVVNAAAFVARRMFDEAAFAQSATLARCLVDDARAFQGPGEPAPRPAIGIIGFEDARAALGLASGAPAREFARRLAALLAAKAGREALALTPQPLLARLANHVADGFDGPDRAALVATVAPWLAEPD
jgi:ribonucleoside-diphosphate reductase alpha chain